MDKRTTVLLDPASRRAAKELAAHLDISASEVIRRALKEYASTARGIDSGRRKKRVQALRRLDALFRGTDPDKEIAARKREDAYW